MRTGRERSDLIKSKAHELGFLACGVARAEYLVEEAPRLERWLREGKHGEMGYMANHFDMRLDPRKLVPGAKSVISLAFNYYTESKQIDPEAPKLSTYAYGRDYHKVVKQRLKPLVAFIQEQFGQIEFRTFVDSAPVLEKAWAQRSGIGWAQDHSSSSARSFWIWNWNPMRQPRTIAARVGAASMRAQRMRSPRTVWTEAGASVTSPSN